MTKLASILSASVLAASLGGCIISTSDDTSDATLSVHNQSDYDIYELYLTHSSSSGWGPDLLHGIPLEPDQIIDLDVSCGTYDAKFVDETGVSCEIDELDLCFSGSDWYITNDTCAFTDFKKSSKKLGTGVTPTKAAK